MAVILNLAILDSEMLVFPLKLTHLPRLVSTIFTKKLHSFILTELDDDSHLEFCHLGFSHFAKKLLTQTSSIWLKLTHSHSTWWWQPSWILPLWIQLFCTKKNFTDSFWLNLMIAAILNSALMDSEDCHLGFRQLVIFSQIHSKHSHCILTLTQTNSIWLKLIHSHWTWWWQSSWIWPSWIQPS